MRNQLGYLHWKPHLKTVEDHLPYRTKQPSSHQLSHVNENGPTMATFSNEKYYS